MKRGVIWKISTFVLLFSIIFFAINTNASLLDSDNDGVPDERDICPSTPSETDVDSKGCNKEQFCGQYLCGNSCDWADWKNDEQGNPYDCRTIIEKNEGTLRPKCIPIYEECEEDKTELIVVPQGNVTFYPKITSPLSYWNVTLSNIPEGYGPINNTSYLGWCVDEANILNQNNFYNTTLYSSYDPSLITKCPYCYDPDWPKVNYILNNKNPNATKEDIQEAIWYFVNGGNWPSDYEAQLMVLEANSSGTDFIPSKGQVIAIILDTGTKTQLVIIEVDP